MADFASQTVAQLKELLKSKGLSTDGKKADLVQRLQAAESSQPEPEAATSEVAPADVPVTEELPTVAAAEATAAEVAAVVAAEAPAAHAAAEEAPKEEEPEKPKVLTAEERKQLAVELLQKKIQRAVKFGDESGAEAAKKDLARVEKFGVELGTALAKEIGLVDRSLGNGFKKHNKHRKNFKPKHKNNKKR